MRAALALAFLLALTLGPMPESLAQAPPAVAPLPPAAAATPPVAAAAFSTAQLDQLIAPIALYPDDLLAQVLTAATYPLEIVMAARWVADPRNAALKGDALTQALQAQPWDPSVKSLVPFPSVLKTMSDQLEWTQKLGDAFLEQPQDCFASVQRLRQRAQSAGKLASSPQQNVTTQGPAIVIAPANPDVVYVPAYDPSIVYGPWPYPAYPPYYYPPPVGYGFGVGLAVGIGFGAGVAISRGLWGWCSPNWRGGTVNVNVNRFNQINVNRTAITSNTWRHDPAHREGVAYRDAATRQRFGQQRTGAAARQEFRGFEARPAVAARTPNVVRGAAAGTRPGAGAAAARTPNARRGAEAAARPAAARTPDVVRGAGTAARPAAFNPGNGTQARAAQARGQASRAQMGNSGGARGAGAVRTGGGGGGSRGGGGRR